MTELKPCPFCGGEAHIYPDDPNFAKTWFYVECIDCHANSKLCKTKQGVIEAWNRREGAKNG